MNITIDTKRTSITYLPTCHVVDASDHDDGDGGAVLADRLQHVLRPEDVLPRAASQLHHRAVRVVTMETDLRWEGRGRGAVWIPCCD